MKRALLLALCMLFVIPAGLMSQDVDLTSLLTGLTAPAGDSLTNSISGFVHVNWSQGGVGLSYKHIMIMYSTTLLPLTKNYNADLTTSVLQGMNPSYYKVNQRYSNIMVGYMLKLAKNFYPYVGTGTATLTDMIEVDDPTDDTGIYTIKGKAVTYGTGIVGAVYHWKKHVILEGSLLIKPMLPFVGIGLVL
jgi:hypothetical protein